MEEFIERFTEFREWLYDQEEISEAHSQNEKTLQRIITKFEELELDSDF